MSDINQQKNNPKKYVSALRYAGLGMQLFTLLGIGIWGGMKLDALIGWEFPLLTICLPLLALGISLWQLIKELGKPHK